MFERPDRYAIQLNRIEAKLDAIMAELGIGAKPNPVDERILAVARQENKIAAIKLCRELTGLGLAEAKDHVENLVSGGGPQDSWRSN